MSRYMKIKKKEELNEKIFRAVWCNLCEYPNYYGVSVAYWTFDNVALELVDAYNFCDS